MRSQILIGITGRKGSGKDTVAYRLVDKFKFEKYSIAAPLKKALQNLFGFTREQLWGDEKDKIDENWNVTPREVMQKLGGEFLLKGIYEYLPTIEKIVPEGMFKVHEFEKWYDKKILFDAYLSDVVSEKGLANLFKCVVSDVRYIEEADAIREKGGIIWKIIRPDMENEDDHRSETEIDDIIADKDFINDKDIPSLYTKIDEEMQKVIYRK